MTHDVDNCTVRYRIWASEKPSAPMLILVHGLYASSHWWDFFAPSLQTDYTVITPDLSGMGNSGIRDEYSFGQYAREVLAIMDAEATENQPIVIAGHSFGSNVVTLAANEYGERLAGMIGIDPLLGVPPQLDLSKKEVKYFSSHAEAKAAYKLIPNQPNAIPEMVSYLAEHAVQESAEGWHFIGDVELLAKFQNDMSAAMNEQVPSAIIHAGDSMVFPKPAADYFRDQVPFVKMFAVENAGHHLFLDQPTAFVDVLRSTIDELLG